ncbi:MAG: SusC/RagA family TonB-linked outer membrane protein [Phocaeicola sp.]|nr:SusC/RagA family TonB-linked outer membrane protein [Phocaeicola sp.]
MKRNLLFKLLLMLVTGLFLSIDAFAQQMTVKGLVKDTTGEPVIGANVVVKGTTNGTITDFDGNFQLTANKGDLIVISFIGYLTQELPASASLNVILKDDTETLDEVVVIGYGVAKKNDLTGSVTAMKPDEKNRGLVTNAQDMMQGKIAGVNVTSSGGAPGTGANIRIRGGSSLNASNDPLIVIDGLAMDNNGVKGLSNPLSMVNPSDIETFTVLKDASATAIYGSRGSNGVIIITTKKGRTAQAPSISYNGNMSINTKKKTINVMNAEEYRQFITNYYGEGSEAYNKMGTANTDWQDQIYRTAISHDHNLTLTGGFKNMPYRVSLGYTNQDGILKTSDFDRYTASASLNPSLLDDHLKINVNMKGMLANTRYANTGAISAATRMDPTQSVKSDATMTITNPYTDMEETINPYRNYGGYFQWLKVGKDYSDPNWPMMAERNAVRNPVAMLEQYNDKAKSKSFIGNLELDYKIHGFEDLRLHMNFGADYSTGKQTTWESPNVSGDNAYYGWNGWNKENKYNLSYNAYAQYYKDFNAKHHFDIMGGYEWQHFHRDGAYDGWGLYQSTNTALDDKGNPLANTPHGRSFKEWETENYLVSFFGRANYTLAERYLFTATVRYDGSSRFKDHWALFPSFAFGWKIKEEAFLKDVDFLSDLKLRLGYGQTGQQEGIGDYTYFASYNVNTNPDSYYPIIGDGTLNRPDAYNNNLTWETTTTYNAGIDFSILDAKLTGSVDYYYRKTTDLLNTV